MGLPQINRLKHFRDFRSVYERGKTYPGEHLMLKVFALPQIESDPCPPRLGISISKKVSKKAVVRNRIKRQLRSLLRQLLPQMRPGLWVIVLVKRNAIECNYEHFLQELKQLFIKANIIHGH